MYKKMNLQFFADEAKEEAKTDNKSGGDADQSKDETADKKYYTQDEIDAMITKRLAREAKKAEKAQQTSTEEKSEPKVADKKTDVDNQKLTALEEKVLCYDHDIAKEYSEDAVALAKAYMKKNDDMDINEAMEKVIKKYPMYVKGYKAEKQEEEDEESEEPAKSWGSRQSGKGLPKADSVEEAFMKKNPGLKI